MSRSASYRAQTKLIVSNCPGIHIRRLQKLLGASFSTTRYHVDSLERNGEIIRSKDGRYDRLFPAGTAEAMKRVYSIFQNKTARRVLHALAEGGSNELTNGDLALRTSLPRSSVSECLANLGTTSMVRRSLAIDGRILYKLHDVEEVVRLLALFERNLMSIATDRFIDLWDI